MNRIALKDEDKAALKYYIDSIKDIIEQKIYFVIHIILVQNTVLTATDLNNDEFQYLGKKLKNILEPEYKKEIINIFLDKKHKVNIERRKLKNLNLLDDTLNSKININIDRIDFYLKLRNNIENILSKKITENRKLISELKNELKIAEKDVLNFIFDYDFHINKEKRAKKITQDLNISVCPYCNREYINSVIDKNDEKIIGPTLDHFLPQNEFPFLALSFYNLIPSCYTCNCSLKIGIPFDLEFFLYPYEDSYEGLVEFKVFLNNLEIKKDLEEKEIEQLKNNKQKVDIKINEISGLIDLDKKKLYGEYTKLKSEERNKTKGSLNVFYTEEIYNEAHQVDAIEIIDKYDKYSKSYIQGMINGFKADEINKEDVYRFYFGNYIKEEDFNKRPLARFTRDITKQLSEIYKIDFGHSDVKKAK